MSDITLSKEKLFAYLIIDDIQVGKEMLNNAKNDDGDSLYKIARMYYDRKDYTKAIEWYRLSAAQNYPSSQFRIGYMYDKAEGVSTDYKFAMQWYLKAYNNGNIAATNNIGVLYEYGQGVTKDKQYALEWYEKSIRQGYEKANSSIERLNKEGFYITARQKHYIQVEKDRNELKKKVEKLEEEKLTYEKEKDDLHIQVKSLEQKIKVLESSQTHDPKRRLIDLSVKVADGSDTTIRYSESDDTETVKDAYPKNDTYYGK